MGSGFPDHRPCTGGGKPWRGSCSSRPAVVPSFSNAGQCPALLPISPWPTAPRGCIGGVPCPQGIGRVWDQDLQLRYSVDGSPTCAPAHFSLPPVSSFSDGTSVLCSCSSRPAVVPAFAAAILQQRRSTFCAPAHLDWRTVPRGRCRRGVIHRLVVVAVAGVSQGFRGRHWSAARSTGGTELGGYTRGQYSLRKVVHPEGSSGPDKLRHLVPGRGVEPLRPHGQRILSAPRLPFRHPGQLAHCGTKLASEHIMLM